MTTPAQPFDDQSGISGLLFDAEAAIDRIACFQRSPYDLSNAIRAELTAAYEAGRAAQGAVPLAALAVMPEFERFNSTTGDMELDVNGEYVAFSDVQAVWPQPAQQAVMPEPVQANFPNDAAIMAMMRNAIGKQSLDIAELHEEVRYLKETLKDQTTTAQPVPPDEQTEFTSSTYDPPGLSNWLVGHDKGVRVTHRSGLFEQCHSERGYHANEALAMSRLKDRLAAQPVQPAFEGDAA